MTANMTPTEARDIVKAKMDTERAYADDVRQHWRSICDKLELWFLAKRPRLKSFEAHHFTESARAIYLRQLALGTSVTVAAELALDFTRPY